MANFKAHLSSGLVNGASVAGIGFIFKELSPIETGTVFILGAVGALLPDLDSRTGKPLAFLSQLLSVLVPILIYPYITRFFNPGTPFLLCYFTSFYLAIHYGVCALITRVTKHRGILHSVPFAVLCAEITFLLMHPSGITLAGMCCIAVFTGCVIHLILDELKSMSVKFGFILVLKNSSGSALKFNSPYILSTMTTYFFILITGLMILSKFVPLRHLLTP